jgi:GAF domain-containing protein
MAARSEMRDELLGFRIPLDEGIAGWVVTNQEPAISNDVAQDERFSSAVDKHIKFRTQSLVALPLISRQKVLGVIELVNKFSKQPFDDQDVETLLLLAALAAMAIDLAGLQTQ